MISWGMRRFARSVRSLPTSSAKHSVASRPSAVHVVMAWFLPLLEPLKALDCELSMLLHGESTSRQALL